MPGKPSIPRLPGRTKDVAAITESLEILTGARGNGLERAVTVRDLVDAGLVRLRRSGQVGAGGVPGAGGLEVPPVEGVETPNKPTGVSATGGFDFIMIDWDLPTFSGLSYAEILRATTDEFGLAVRVATTTSNVYVDPVGMQKAYYYWIRFVNTDGVTGPLHDTAGLYAETAEDIDAIKAILEGQIEASQLAASLNTRIDLIDAADSVPGSVAARVKTETDARTTADSAIVTSVSTLQTTVNGNTSSISTLQTTTNGLAAEYMVKLDVNGYVSGFGLYNDGPGASGFLIHADWFAIGRPGYTTGYPFIVGTVGGTTKIVLDAATFIADATITSAKIGMAAVTTAKIQDAAISSAKIADLGVTNAKIGNAAITEAKIGSLAVTEAKIASLAVTSAKIADLAVDTIKIAGEAVSVPSGINQDLSITLSTVYQVVCSVTVDVGSGDGAPGAVLVTAFHNYQNTVATATIYDLAMIITANGVAGGSVAMTHQNQTAVITSNHKFTGLSGSVTFTIQVKKNNAAGTFLGRNSGLVIQAVKR